MKTARCVRPVLSVLLSLSLAGISSGQDIGTPAPAQKYKLTIVEGASTSKRAKKGRVSSQTVIKITDQNNVPVSGILVTFTIPQFVGGATFANGALTSLVTTNAAGLATSSALSTAVGSSFSLSVAAAVPGGALTAAVPVSAAATAAAAGGAAGGPAGGAAGGAAAGGAAAGAGISAGVIGAIVAGVAAAAVGIGVGVAKGGGSTNPSSPPASPSGTIGAAGVPTFGHP